MKVSIITTCLSVVLFGAQHVAAQSGIDDPAPGPSGYNDKCSKLCRVPYDICNSRCAKKPGVETPCEKSCKKTWGQCLVTVMDTCVP